MTRTPDSSMRLRGIIRQPNRFEDEDIHARRPYEKRNGTKPALPNLLAAQVVPFNPDQPPAAFPTCPLDGSRTQQKEPARPASSVLLRESPEPKINPLLDVSRLVDDSDDFASSILSLSTEFGAGEEWNTVDFSMSNNLAAGDTQGADPLHLVNDDLLDGPIEWDSLELAYQYRIFRSLRMVLKDGEAIRKLQLTNAQGKAINKAISWRQAFPITLTRHCDSQDIGTNYLEPDLLMKYADVMVKASHYELGSPHQLLRAATYLRQVELPSTVLGTWIEDPQKSGQLIDATPQLTRPRNQALTTEQLQDLCVQAARRMRPSLKKNKHTQPAMSGKNVLKPVARHLVGRPRKQTSPTSKTDQDNAPTPTHTSQGTTNVVQEDRAPSAVPSESTNESSEDPIEMLKRWTQPVPKTQPRLPAASATQELPKKDEQRAATSITKSGNAQVTGPPSRSANERSSGPMNLRNRETLKETEAMSTLRRDRDFWSQSHATQSSERSSTEPPESDSPQTGKLPSSVGRRTPKMKLTISRSGVASVLREEPPSMPVARGGKSLDSFAGGSALQAESSMARASDRSTTLAPLCTPRPIITKTGPPTRAEDDFKQKVQPIYLPPSSPTKFGDPDDFETKLLLSPAAALGTPKLDDLGVFEAKEVPSSKPTRTEQGDPDVDKITLREWITQSSPGTTVQSSPLARKGTPLDHEIVPSIEDDITMLDATSSPSALHSKGLMRREAFTSQEDTRIGTRRSPSPPRSSSPISVNGDFEEYQAWLRGERQFGPMPKTLMSSPSRVDRTSQRRDTASSSAIGRPTSRVALPVTDSIATPSLRPPAEPEHPSLKVTLKVFVPNEMLQSASGTLFASTSDRFVDPGEEGDGDWEESKSEKKLSPKLSSPKDLAVPKKELLRKQKKSGKPSEMSISTKKAPGKKIPVALPVKRTTRAQSLAANEMSDTPEPRSRSATPIPSIEINVARTSALSNGQKRPAQIGPRRSGRLSSAEVTNDSDNPGPPVRKSMKRDAPLRAKLTPVSRLRKPMTPAGAADQVGLRQQAAVQSLQNEAIVISDSASEVDTEATSVEGSKKPRKKWTPKPYTKSRGSSRLADMNLPNMKV